MVRSGPLKNDHYPQTQQLPMALHARAFVRYFRSMGGIHINAEEREHERRHQTTIIRVSSFTPFVKSILFSSSLHEHMKDNRWLERE